MLGEELVGRGDLKADRAGGSLVVKAVHWEPGTDVPRAAPALQEQLELMASWRGLQRVDFAKP